MAYTTRFGKIARMRKDAIGNRYLSYPVVPSDVSNADAVESKGELGGSCNRSGCLRPNSAFWYNHSTRKHYCRACAEWLNSDPFNKKDAMELWGHDLCTLVDGEHHG